MPRVCSPVIERFTQLPQSLRERSGFIVWERQGAALLTHPDWISPSPIVIWMHGARALKELDAGRYLRWLRASGPRGERIAACAVDLPGHGERYDRELQHPRATIRVLRQMLGEIDQVLELPADPVAGRFRPGPRGHRRHGCRRNGLASPAL